MFRGKRLDFHHQKTITNHTRKGINRILIRTAGRTRRRSLTGLKGIEGGVVSPHSRLKPHPGRGFSGPPGDRRHQAPKLRRRARGRRNGSA
jgi:hypothetical protein